MAQLKNTRVTGSLALFGEGGSVDDVLVELIKNVKNIFSGLYL